MGAQAGSGQAVLHPRWRGGNLDAGDNRRRVAQAEVGVSDGYLRQSVHRRTVLGIADFRHADGLAGDGAQLSSHAQDGKTIPSVGCQFQLQESVAKDCVQRGARRGIGGQHDDAVVFVAEPEFGLGANHAL